MGQSLRSKTFCCCEKPSVERFPPSQRENGGKTPWHGGPLVINPIYIHLIYWVLGMSPFQGLVQGVNSYVPSQGYHQFPYDRDFLEVRSPDFQEIDIDGRKGICIPTNTSPMDPMGEEVCLKMN